MAARRRSCGWARFWSPTAVRGLRSRLPRSASCMSIPDLGCAYTLKVAPDGSGTLRTTLGWVGFHTNGRDSFIPAGAMCLTRPGLGPGTPFLEDSSEEFRLALHAVDFEELSPAGRQKALGVVLAEARRQDAFTLWHLLARVSDEERPTVYERMRRW